MELAVPAQVVVVVVVVVAVLIAATTVMIALGSGRNLCRNRPYDGGGSVVNQLTNIKHSRSRSKTDDT